MAYIAAKRPHCFVCENSLDGSIVGYAVSASDAKVFHSRFHVEWLPGMRAKYPRKVMESASNEVIL